MDHFLPAQPWANCRTFSRSLLALAFGAPWGHCPRHSLMRRSAASPNRGSGHVFISPFLYEGKVFQGGKKWISDKMQAWRALEKVLTFCSDRLGGRSSYTWWGGVEGLGGRQRACRTYILFCMSFSKFPQHSFPHFLKRGISYYKHYTQSLYCNK